MDFRTKIDNQVFGVRATALIVRDGQIYLAKSPEGKYYCIGGAIAVGETTEEAVQREVREEVGCDVTVDQLAFVVENQFELDGTHYHQMEFHYLVTPVTEPQAVMVEGGRSLTCEWVAIDDLPAINLNPPFLKTALRDWDGQIKHIVNIENQ